MKLTRAYCITFVALICGCVTTSPADMAKSELAAEYLCADLPFSSINGCVQQQFNTHYAAWRSDANADLVNIFLAWTNAEAARVAAGEVPEADAKGRARTLQSRLDQVAVARRNQSEVNSQAAAGAMLVGLAVLNNARPAVIVPPPLYPIATLQQSSPPPTAAPVFHGSAPLYPAAMPYVAPPGPNQIVCSTIDNAQFATVTCR